MAGGRLDCLTVLSPLTAFLSLAIISVAISTNSWLLTEEKMPNPKYNGTGDNEFLSKITISGLWTFCYTNPGEMSLHCHNINYFPHEEYSPDPNDSTMVIPYAVTRSASFFFIATFLLFWAEFSCIYGLIHRSKRIYTFISGVVFIISGLLMLIGMVMYISVFKAEIGGKLRPRSHIQPPLFTFEYGYSTSTQSCRHTLDRAAVAQLTVIWRIIQTAVSYNLFSNEAFSPKSFLLYVSGFVSIETAGTCAVLLYIYWHQKDWGRKTLEMTMMNHHRKLSSSDVLLPDQHIYSSGVLYPCRRHPQYSQPIMGNHISHVDRASPAQHQRRLYLEQGESEDSQPPTPRQSASSCVGVCLAPHHDHQRVSSVTSTYYSYPDDAYHPSELDVDVPIRPWDLPRDLTAHTVSTTADINSCEGPDDLSPPHADFVSFDLDEVPPLRTPSESRRSDYESSLRRTTPV